MLFDRHALAGNRAFVQKSAPLRNLAINRNRLTATHDNQIANPHLLNTASLYSVFDVLEQYGIRDYFEDVTLSSVTGYRKPHPSIFQISLRQMQAKPEECAYVGDTISRDIIGAKRMHFGAAIQIQSFLSAQKDAGVDAAYQPDHIIRELPELVDYLEERNRAERLTMQ